MSASSPSLRLSGAYVIGAGSAQPQDLYLEDGRIVDRCTRSFDDVDLSDHLIFPGLINAHDHLQLNVTTDLRPQSWFPDSEQWAAWLQRQLSTQPCSTLQAPRTARLWQGGLKNLLAGVTTVAHHDPADPCFLDPAFPVRLAPSGWCHSLAMAGNYGPSVAESRLQTPERAPWMIHLAEGISARAKSELDRLLESQALDARTVLIHGVALTSDQIRKVIDFGAAVVWCPASNLTMMGCTLDPTELHAAGRLALGTDSRLTGSQDLLLELKVAAGSASLTAQDLCTMVTSQAARILNLEDVGSLKAGSRADLLVLRAGNDPWQTLIGAQRSSLRAVFLDGKPRVVDADLHPLFEGQDISWTEIRLDGKRKRIDSEVLGDPEAWCLEPGLEVLSEQPRLRNKDRA